MLITELESWEIKDKKVYELLTNLAEIEKFGIDFLAEVVSQEKAKEHLDVNCLEQLIKNKTEFLCKIYHFCTYKRGLGLLVEFHMQPLGRNFYQSLIF